MIRETFNRVSGLTASTRAICMPWLLLIAEGLVRTGRVRPSDHDDGRRGSLRRRFECSPCAIWYRGLAARYCALLLSVGFLTRPIALVFFAQTVLGGSAMSSGAIGVKVALLGWVGRQRAGRAFGRPSFKAWHGILPLPAIAAWRPALRRDRTKRNAGCLARRSHRSRGVDCRLCFAGLFTRRSLDVRCTCFSVDSASLVSDHDSSCARAGSGYTLRRADLRADDFRCGNRDVDGRPARDPLAGARGRDSRRGSSLTRPFAESLVTGPHQASTEARRAIAACRRRGRWLWRGRDGAGPQSSAMPQSH